MHPHPSLRFLIACTAFGVYTRAFAQTTTSDAPASGDDTVVLPVFEVKTDKDQGYNAQNTAAGSRLNTKLSDTPGSISVMTSDFINDIGATSIEDLAGYAMNTEPLAGMAGDVANGNEFSSGRADLRVRGLPTTRTVDFFIRQGEVDTYNADRVELARGANALLFGLGGAGGVFNTSTKHPNLSRSSYELSFRAGDWDQARGTVDFNVPVLKDKIGLRINALDESRNSWRPNEGRDAKRVALAGRWQITSKLRFDLEYEINNVFTQTQRKWAGFDSYTTWHNAGEHIDAGGNGNATSPITLQRNAYGITTQAGLSTLYWAWNSTLNQLVNYSAINANNIQTKSNATGSPITGLNTAQENPMLLDFDLVPKRATIGGPGIGNQTDQNILTAILTLEPIKNLFIELAQNRQDFDSYGYDIGNTEVRVQWDTSPRLTDGTTNPYAGKPFVEVTPNLRAQHVISDDSRLTGAYELDLGHFWGRHRFAGLLERRDERTASYNAIRKIVNPGAVTDLSKLSANARTTILNAASAGPNSLHYRAYVDLDGPVEDIAVSNFRDDPTGLSAWVPVNNVIDSRSVTTSAMIATQSYLWSDRVVGTFGYRKDWVETYDSSSAPGPDTHGGVFTTGDLVATRNSAASDASGITRTIGGVFHSTSWLSLVANKSNSFNLPNPTARIANATQATSTLSDSNDYGVKLSFLDGRVYTTINYFETAARNDTGSLNVGVTVGGINAIWDALQGAGVALPNGATYTSVRADFNSFTFDSASQGWEVEIVANPTSNWRIRLAGSDSITRRTNSGTELFAYMDTWRPLWNANGSLAAASSTSGAATVADRLAEVDADHYIRIVQPDGHQALGNGKYTANFRTTYSFDHGWFDGWSIGGGARWTGKAPTSYDSAGNTIDAPAYTIYDLNLGYKTRLPIAGQRLSLSFQLNVNNLLDRQDIIPTRLYEDGTIRTYRLQDPRQIFGTVTIKY